MRAFSRAAHDRAGSSEKLAELLADAGVQSNRTSGPLKANTIGQWMRGIAVPPADTLLAMAAVTGLSLDGLLRSDFDGPVLPHGEEQIHLSNLQADVVRMRKELRLLQRRVAANSAELEARKGD